MSAFDRGVEGRQEEKKKSALLEREKKEVTSAIKGEFVWGRGEMRTSEWKLYLI